MSDLHNLVQTEYGQIRGVTKNLGYEFGVRDAFYGIPYANPPFGDLRFKPPVPHNQWQGVIDADTLRNACTTVPDTNS